MNEEYHHYNIIEHLEHDLDIYCTFSKESLLQMIRLRNNFRRYMLCRCSTCSMFYFQLKLIGN